MTMDTDRDFDIFSSTNGSTVAGERTPPPSDSSISDGEPPQFESDTKPYYKRPFYNDTVPCPGNTYIIRDPISGRQITLERGELVLKHHAGEQGGFHWICIENGGWLGFYDPIHSMYMGRDNKGGYMAKVKNHRGWEHFCARRHPNGGYLLLTQHWDKLMKMEISRNGTKLVETFGEGKGTAWEFVKVD
ncbi:hypothetical protein F5B19DRAFT_478091 [Rostrohypoxylon terebratum]|nr:hypothetical protein F5B19DRAFT_478091 [Rostrohypoxylon terebratum]